MKKIFLMISLITLQGTVFSMVKAGIETQPEPVYPEETEDYYYNWYGPGMYYGVYFSDYPTYYAWQRRHYYGGPYYWRYHHHHGNWNGHHDHHHGGEGHHHQGGHGHH